MGLFDLNDLIGALFCGYLTRYAQVIHKSPIFYKFCA